MGITVVSSILLMGIIVMILYIYGIDSPDRKVISGLRAFGFFLMFIQTIVVFIRIPITYANQVTTFKVVTMSMGYLLIVLSLVFEVLHLKSYEKKSKPKKVSRKK